MKLCKDCRYLLSGLQHLCVNPNNGKARSRWATINRSDHSLCGPEGAWFETIPVPQPKKSFWRRIFE